MGRGQKPPGKEDRTWMEIDTGRRMTEREARAIQLACWCGCYVDEDGNLRPAFLPRYLVVILILLGLLILGLVVTGVVVPESEHHAAPVSTPYVMPDAS